MNARIRILLPNMDKASSHLGMGGGGFGWADVEFKVNGVGSKSLYQLIKVSHKGREVPLDAVERLNAPEVIDETIALKIHGEYAKTVQQQPVTKRKKTVRKVEENQSGQSEMPLL